MYSASSFGFSIAGQTGNGENHEQKWAIREERAYATKQRPMTTTVRTYGASGQ